MLDTQSISDLKELLNLYMDNSEKGSIALNKGDWVIAEGGYNKWWELYFGEIAIPVADCIAGEVNVYGDTLSNEDKVLVKNVILETLKYLSVWN